MPCTHTVDVTIPVDPSIAATLDDAGIRMMVGYMVSRMLKNSNFKEVTDSILALKTHAHALGLNDDLLNDEFIDYNAERREADALPGS